MVSNAGPQYGFAQHLRIDCEHGFLKLRVRAGIVGVVAEHQPQIGAREIVRRKKRVQHRHLARGPIAKIAYGLYKGQFLKAVSVGFVPIRWEDGTAKTDYRRKFVEQELDDKKNTVTINQYQRLVIIHRLDDKKEPHLLLV